MLDSVRRLADMTASFRSVVRTYFGIGAALCALAIYQTEAQTEAFLKLRTRYKWAVLMLLFGLNAVGGLYIMLRPEPGESLLKRIHLKPPPRSIALIAAAVLLVLPFPVLWYARGVYFGEGLGAFFRLMWLFWWLLLLQAVGLKLAGRLAWSTSLAIAMIFDGVAAEIYVLFLPVTDFPFSLGWSEASRFYYGSLLFARSIYGTNLPLSIWHGTRYMLLSLPFLSPGLPLWAARLWQVVLWIGTTFTSSLLLVKRLRIPEWTVVAVLVGWFFLYLFQGAVYYHLQICVILILMGVRRGHPVQSLLAVIAASFWAGMSRLNWYPVPAMLAIGLYLLEESYTSTAKFWGYVAKPVLWATLGMATALAGQAFYIAISGDTNLAAFGSSLTSALLWYRWLPSPTNPIGIIPGILIVSLPLWALIYWSVRGRLGWIHPIRWITLLAMLLVLFVGGLIVSSKIGGGGDLHNMDAYMVLLGIVAVYFLAGCVAAEPSPSAVFGSTPWPIIACMLLVPVGFTFLRVAPPFSYDAPRANADLSAVRQSVESYAQTGPVLFIYERQLLTFNYIPHVPIVPDYEVVSLMEMAISGNRTYLTEFYTELANHRFAAIVVHPQNLGVETGDFIEESNAWNRLVGQPLLCQYKPALTLEYSKIQILIPRARACAEFPPALTGP